MSRILNKEEYRRLITKVCELQEDAMFVNKVSLKPERLKSFFREFDRESERFTGNYVEIPKETEHYTGGALHELYMESILDDIDDLTQMTEKAIKYIDEKILNNGFGAVCELTTLKVTTDISDNIRVYGLETAVLIEKINENSYKVTVVFEGHIETFEYLPATEEQERRVFEALYKS